MVQQIPDVDLDQWYEEPEEAARILPASEFSADVLERFSSDDQGSCGIPLPWEKARGRWALRPCELTVWAGINGSGKATSLDTPIPVPDGWKTMGEIRVGDIVFDDCGQQCRVKAATEVMYGRPCYKIMFSDGAQIVCDSQHEWMVYTAKCRQSLRNARNRIDRKGDPNNDQTHKRTFPQVLTTSRIAEDWKVPSGCWEGLNNYSVHVAQSLDLGTRKLPVHPYLLGIWLGDGTSTGAQITTPDREVLKPFENQGYEVRKLKAKYLYSIVGGFIKDLRSANVIGNKHVPEEYLRAGNLQRLWLLQGLMDSDGYITSSGHCEFTSTRKELADAVTELVNGLGGQSKIKEGRATLYGKDCGPKYLVKFTPSFPAFRLQRKRQYLKDSISERAKHRFIVSCERVESVPVRCIEVDSPSHMYLCTRSMIPTHNSLITGHVALDLAARGQKVCIASMEMLPATTLYRMTRQALGERAPMRERITAFHGATDGLIWLFDHRGTIQWQKMVALGRYCATALKVQHLFIDSLMKLGIGTDDYDGQKRAVNELCAMAHDTGLHVHLIHHARKSGSEDHPLDKFSVKGAGEIMDLADNGVLVWRNKPKEREAEKMDPDRTILEQADLMLDLCKQRDGEYEGRFKLWFHPNSMQFLEEQGPPTDYLNRFTNLEAA